jgi:hypothetical protein
MASKLKGAGWLISTGILFSSLAYVSISLAQTRMEFDLVKKRDADRIASLETKVSELEGT